MSTPTLDEVTRGLQSWAGAEVDGAFGPDSIRAAWDKAGRPRYVEPDPPRPPVRKGVACPWLADLWESAHVKPEWVSQADHTAARIQAGRERYNRVEAATKVPWHIIGVLHLMECDLSFGHHLHNGDSLSARTHNVPANRPAGDPPFSWEESAIDALKYDKLNGRAARFWSDPSQVLDMLERYNGVGYRNKGIFTPYLWSGTQHYTKGKYVRDGIYDANAVSKQLGIVPVLRSLEQYT